MKRTGVTIALALLCAATTAAAQTTILEQILVKVNGEIITKSDLEERQIQALRLAEPDLRPDDDAALQRALAAITPQVIVVAVDELLYVQRGRELGYVLGDEQFQSIVANIKSENKLESDEQFQQALDREGLTLADLRRQLEHQMLVSRVQQNEVMNKISVTDEEIQRYYDANPESFTTPARVTLREILISVPTTDQGINVAADDEAKSKAEAILQRLDTGEPFARLAAEVSDSPSKANGGLIGPLNLSDLSPELQQAIEGLETGGLTPALRTPRGYQILKLESLESSVVRSFTEARTEISQRVGAAKRDVEFGRYLEKLRALAIIEWKNDEVKRAYELGLEKRTASE